MRRRLARATRHALATALTAVASALCVRPALAQQAPASPAALGAEEALLELRLARRQGVTVGAWRRGDEALVPMPEFCALVELQCVLRDGALRALLPPDARALVIPLASDGSASNGTRAVSLARGDVAVAADTLFVATRVLASLFAIDIRPSWADALVDIPELTPFPIGLRLAREAARRLVGPAASMGPPDTALALRRPWLDGSVLDYTLQLQQGVTGQTMAAFLNGGANLLGGSLSAARAFGAGATASTTTARWLGVWGGRSWLRVAQVGDAIVAGPNPRALRGFALTNTPYLRSSWVGRVAYDGVLAPGTVVEAYAGGQLVAYDSTDPGGQWRLTLPIAYGENLVELAAYLPDGRLQRFTRSYRVLGEVIPRRTVEYSIAGGACRPGLACGTTWLADVRWAPTSRLTLRAGADGFGRDTLRDLVHPYVGVIGSAGRMLSGSAILAHGAPSRLFLAFEPSFDRRFFLNYSVADRTLADPVLGRPGDIDQLSLTALLRPSAFRDRIYGELTAIRMRTTAVTSAQLRTAVSTQWGMNRLTPYTKVSEVGVGSSRFVRTGIGADAVAQPPATWGRRASTIFLRANVERPDVTAPGAQWSLSLARPFFRWIRLEAGVQKAPGMPGPAFTILVNADRREVRSIGMGSVQGPAWSYAQNLTGTLIGSRPERQGLAQRGPGVDRAGITGIVYADADGDGVHDPSEPTVPDVAVRAGNMRAVTDAQGRYRIWDLVPWEPVRVDVDEATLPTPLLRPRFPSIEIAPGPNGVERLDLAFVQAGSVEGSVVRELPDGRRFPLPGVPVLLESGAGVVAQRVTTFSDGEFVALGVPPGTYQLRVERSYLEGSGLADVPVPVVVRALPDGDQVAGLSVVVRAFQGPQAKAPIVVAPRDGDDDADGARNSVDRCPGTPRGTRVDATGCPVTSPKMQRLVVLRGVNFETGRAVLTPASFAVLDSVAADLVTEPEGRIEVGGHTDVTGTRPTNLRLSQARADTVRLYLVRQGVDSARLTARGYGPDRPMATNATAAGRAQNRRVELKHLDDAAGEDSVDAGGFTLRVGTYLREADAARARDGYLRRDIEARSTQVRVAGRVRWAVDVGSFATEDAARLSARRTLGAAASRARVVPRTP